MKVSLVRPHSGDVPRHCLGSPAGPRREPELVCARRDASPGSQPAANIRQARCLPARRSQSVNLRRHPCRAHRRRYGWRHNRVWADRRRYRCGRSAPRRRGSSQGRSVAGERRDDLLGGLVGGTGEGIRPVAHGPRAWRRSATQRPSAPHGVVAARSRCRSGRSQRCAGGRRTYQRALLRSSPCPVGLALRDAAGVGVQRPSPGAADRPATTGRQHVQGAAGAGHQDRAQSGHVADVNRGVWRRRAAARPARRVSAAPGATRMSCGTEELRSGEEDAGRL
jgi:hypothetical protein